MHALHRATLRVALATTLAAVPAAFISGQQTGPGSSFVAFRVDANHVIATLKVLDTQAPPGAGVDSLEPMARFGFRPVDVPDAWRSALNDDIRAGERWVIHAGSNKVFAAESERLVGGSLQCLAAVGVLLRVVPDSADSFATMPAKYFVAERSASPPSTESPPVASARTPSNSEFQRAVRAALNELLARELPRVQADSRAELERMASSSVGYHRTWARQQQTVDDAMASGRGELKYDIQSFRLAPDSGLVHFVRAEWLVGSRQGFAASLWLRGDERLEVVETNLRPASWLRMFEFQGKVAPENLGLVLNVFDRNRDGWREVLLAQGGYESMTLSLVEYSATGFRPTGIEYSYGC